MHEEKQYAIRGVPHPHRSYFRTATDNWIDAGVIVGGVCTAFGLLVFLYTRFPIFLWLMWGALSAIGVLWWWRTFRRTAWSLQQSWDERPGDRPVTKAKRLFLGSALLIAGVLVNVFVSLRFNSSQVWWVPLFSGPFILGLTTSGVAVIAQALKSSHR